MASLEQLTADMKSAMKAKESEKLGTIRMLISAIKNKNIELKRDMTDEEIFGLLTTEVKKRRDAAKVYRDGDRVELAEKEESEIVFIQAYLPEQLSDEDVAKMVDEAIAQTGATSKADMGKVMGPVIAKTKGRFDGGKVKDIVMSKLS